jgi:integrase
MPESAAAVVIRKSVEVDAWRRHFGSSTAGGQLVAVCGRSDGSTLFFPGREGRPWADHDWRNWRKRVYAPVADAVELDGSRPYDLRHAFCSLLIAQGLSVVEIAQQAGHSPAMMLATYAHLIEELAGTERRPAETVIRDARDKLVSEMCPPARRQRRH